MSCYTPDSWIERRGDYGLTTDDAGFCEICGHHLDSGRCPGHCENDTCGHVSHCDVCERGLNYTPDSGVCFVCESEWLAGRALTYTPPKDCILCGKPTRGSVGAAGIKWSFICQPCKDREDGLLGAQIQAQAFLFDKLLGGAQ